MKITLAGLVVLAVMLSGCGGAAEETPTPQADRDQAPAVSVTGKVVPVVWATVGAQTGGTVLEVLVEPGDVMATDDLLVRLDPTDAQLAVRRAEVALEAAKAQLAVARAGARAEEIAIGEAEVDAAQAALSQAAAQRDQLRAGAVEAEIAAAQAQVTTAQVEQLTARETHKQTMKCYDFTLPDGTKGDICPLLGPAEEQARYNLQAAGEELDAAQAQLDALVAGADDRVLAADAAVQAVEAQREVAQAQLDLLLAGATHEEIAALEAAVAQAQAALDAAQVALERTEVRAPIAGTVGAVVVRAGELVAPGQPLVTLGDLDSLRVETTDLDESEVALVKIGQEAAVTFDALPQRVFTGRVTRVSPMAESGGGGVNYTVVIELDGMDPVVRWGMTAFVDFD